MTYRCTQVGCNALVPDGFMHSCLDVRRTLVTTVTAEIQAEIIADATAEATGDAATGYKRLIPVVSGLN